MPKGRQAVASLQSRATKKRGPNKPVKWLILGAYRKSGPGLLKLTIVPDYLIRIRNQRVGKL